jgi:hypothetical protein
MRIHVAITQAVQPLTARSSEWCLFEAAQRHIAVLVGYGSGGPANDLS